jgi:pyridoxal phosphate enzyme (YggS family)
MPSLAHDIAARLASIRERIARAAERSGRSADHVRLIAVSKTFPADAVRAAYEAGQRDFGENKVQEGLQKIDQTRDLALTWHLIGHLQSNKAKKAATAFPFIHAVDSPELLRLIDRSAADAGARPRLLVQVDLAGETTKFGARPDEVRAIFDEAARCTAATLEGLMILPPFADNPEDARPWFRQLRELAATLVSNGVPAAMVRELSMGMSHDFDVAIEEGATMVRVGTAIFGERSTYGREST